MKRPPPGHYLTVSTQGEPFRAFVPAPLPPQPPLVWSAALRRRFDDALLAVGRLDALSGLLPNSELLLYSFVRKEAVLSSQIEGTQSSLSDLLLFEADELPGVPLDDAREVSRCVAAMAHGLARLRGGFPLSLRLLRDMHAVLLDHPQGRGKTPVPFAARKSGSAAHARATRSSCRRQPRSWPTAWTSSSVSCMTTPSRHPLW
jgi:Fic family protein